MRRNLLLLTAVVLAAVILSGCAMWPFGIAVTYELEKDVFVAHKNPKRVDKEAFFEPEFTFAEGKNATGLDVSVMAGKTEIDHDEEDLKDEAGNVIGIIVSIPNVGKKPIKISILAPEPVQ